MSLAEKTALVTGGGRGIGRAIAERLHADGARVVVTGRNRERLDEVAAAVGGEAVPMDMADRASIAAGLEAIAERVGRVDILVNNAGIAPGAPLHRVTDEIWDQVMAINATGPFLLCRALIPAMAKAGWGRVVNVASIAGLTGQAYTLPYCASKHAVIGMTRALAAELGPTGVTINAVCPGWVATDMATDAIDRIAATTKRSADEARATLESVSPQRRLVEASEVAHLVASLCAEEARGVHGQAIPIDGGTVLK